MSKSKVLFLMTGSIACYKACQAISRLVQNNCDVQVVASTAALQFVGSATLEGLSGRPVVSDMYAAGNVMDHIHLVRWADLIVVAPATANFVNKAAQGIADDLLHTLFMAHDFKKPFLIAPAMNVAMYEHPLTQASLQKLKELGLLILDGAPGSLACGEVGKGRLVEPEALVKAILETLSGTAVGAARAADATKTTSSIEKIKILLTSGGTQEPIDTVRVISNLSSGRTGKEIAEGLHGLGFDVTILKSHNSPSIQSDIKQKTFTSFKTLEDQLKSALSEGSYSHVIHLAAVSDYSVSEIRIEDKSYRPFEVPKLSSDAESIQLVLTKNPKLVDLIKGWSPHPIKVVAFKLTSQANPSERHTAVQKLFAHSNADWVVHNDLSEIDIVHKKHVFHLHTGIGANLDAGPTSVNETREVFSSSERTCNGTAELIKALSTEILKGAQK